VKGEYVRMRREALGLTQVEFARRLGVTPAAVSRWENGKRDPTGNMLALSLQILGGENGWAMRRCVACGEEAEMPLTVGALSAEKIRREVHQQTPLAFTHVSPEMVEQTTGMTISHGPSGWVPLVMGVWTCAGLKAAAQLVKGA
jgi:transcriptional regulator with XRE-family HTH domain